jgi:transposase
VKRPARVNAPVFFSLCIPSPLWHNRDKAYDKKYLERAIGCLSEGHSYRETAAVFKVSAATLQAWKSRLNETGTFAPKKRKETYKKIDLQKLRRYVDEHPDAYRHEMAAAFSVSRHAIRKALKRLKITRKKTTQYRERDEIFCRNFVETLKAEAPENLV